VYLCSRVLIIRPVSIGAESRADRRSRQVRANGLQLAPLAVQATGRPAKVTLPATGSPIARPALDGWPSGGQEKLRPPGRAQKQRVGKERLPRHVIRARGARKSGKRFGISDPPRLAGWLAGPSCLSADKHRLMEPGWQRQPLKRQRRARGGTSLVSISELR